MFSGRTFDCICQVIIMLYTLLTWRFARPPGIFLLILPFLSLVGVEVELDCDFSFDTEA